MPAETTKDLFFTTQGLNTGTTWNGKFVVKLTLSPRDNLRADRLYREYLGDTSGASPSEFAVYQSYMLSQLAVRLTEAPSWWKDANNGLDVQDENLLEEVFKAAAALVKQYQDERAKAAEAAQAKIRQHLAKETVETGLDQ